MKKEKGQMENLQVYEKELNKLKVDVSHIDYKKEYENILETFKRKTRIRKNSKMFRNLVKYGFENIAKARVLKLQHKQREKELLKEKFSGSRKTLNEKLRIERDLRKNTLYSKEEMLRLQKELGETSKYTILPYELRRYLITKTELTNEEFRELNTIYEDFRDTLRKEIKPTINKLKKLNLTPYTIEELESVYKIVETEYSWFKLLERLKGSYYFTMRNLLVKEELKGKVKEGSKLHKVLSNIPKQVGSYYKYHAEVTYLEKEHLEYIKQNYEKVEEVKTQIEEEIEIYTKRRSYYEKINTKRAKEEIKNLNIEIRARERLEQDLQDAFYRYEDNLNERGESELISAVHYIERAIESETEKKEKEYKETVYETLLDLERMDKAILQKYSQKVYSQIDDKGVISSLSNYYGEIEVEEDTLALFLNLLQINNEAKELHRYIQNMVDFKALEGRAILLGVLEANHDKNTQNRLTRGTLDGLLPNIIENNLDLIIKKNKGKKYYKIKPKNINRIMWVETLGGTRVDKEITLKENLIYKGIPLELEEKYFQTLLRQKRSKEENKEFINKKKELIGYLLKEQVLKTDNKIVYLTPDYIVIEIPTANVVQYTLETSLKNCIVEEI